MQKTRQKILKDVDQGIKLIAVGTIILCVGLIICSLTITKFTGVIENEPVHFVPAGTIVSVIGTTIWVKGAAVYLKAALKAGYVDDSI